MEAFYIQLTTLLSLVCGNFLAGIAPLLIVKAASGVFCSEHFIHKRNRIVTFFLVFGGGVFMSTSFLILVPETRKHYGIYEASRYSTGKNDSASRAEAFPIPEFIVLCGFFATFAIEELLHYIVHHFQSKKPSSHSDVRVRFCSCAKRHTECSRTFKADVPDQTMFGLEKKNSALCLEYSEFNRPIEQATNITTNLLLSQGPPNYGSVTDERTNTPVNVLTPPPMIAENTNPAIAQQNNQPSSTHATSNLFLLAILCCHAALQGINIGLVASSKIGQTTATWTMLLVLSLQQTLLSFVVGNVGLSNSCSSNVGLSNSGSSLPTALSYIAAISVMSPLGIGITMLLNGEFSSDLAFAVVKGLLCGSLLYFTFYDLLGRQSLKEAPHLSRFIGFSVGAALVALLLYASGIV